MKQRITKKEWYKLGGFANADLFRKHNGRSWEYYKTIDNNVWW